MLRAVVPFSILCKWDAFAVINLAALGLRLYDENERLKEQINGLQIDLDCAEHDAANAWHMVEQERDLNRELADRTGARIGITQQGDVLVLPEPDICPCCGENMPPGATFCCSDDFPEPGDVRESE